MNAEDKAWIGRTQGRLTVLGIVSWTKRGKSGVFRTKCECGRTVFLNKSELAAGLMDCGCMSDATPVRFAMSAYSLATGAVPREVAKAYQDCKDQCPQWWATTLSHVVEGVANMLARKRYTEEHIAEWWDCPVEFVRAVNEGAGKRIEALHRDYETLQKVYEASLDPIPKGGYRLYPQHEVINSLRKAMSAKSLYARLSRRESEL